ncbi:MAG: hypothetical protein ACI9TY_000409 [Alphaproteobacteria bacterium]|jgi:hypothetical protein
MVFQNKFVCFLGLLMFVNASFAAGNNDVLEWRVESTLKKLEKAPAYANDATPFHFVEKPVVVEKAKKFEIPTELTESQKRSLEAADVLSKIRVILNDQDIFNADTSNIVIDAVIQSDGRRSALIKNRWYEENAVMDVPIIAKENLVSLVELLANLDESLAEVVESQVNEKIEMVHNLSLKIQEINDDNVKFIDDQGTQHVIKFKPRSF